MSSQTRGTVRAEPSAKRVRAFINGAAVFDTIRPWLVWEGPRTPVYYVPTGDVRQELLVPSARVERSPTRGTARFWHLRVGERLEEDAVREYQDSPLEEIRDLLRFEWAAMDAWFEEDEEIFTHPRDPYHRIDILRSSRHVEVQVNGVTVADSHRPTLLFETGLPTRYYLPPEDVRSELLRPSEKSTGCPYKGTASYWSLEAGGQRMDDVIWSYQTPLRESAPIAGLLAFYNEAVDIRVDGVLQERPVTTFWRTTAPGAGMGRS